MCFLSQGISRIIGCFTKSVVINNLIDSDRPNGFSVKLPEKGHVEQNNSCKRCKEGRICIGYEYEIIEIKN